MSRTLIDTLEQRRLLTAYVVNTSSDADAPADGLVSLREAITAANTNTASGDATAGNTRGDTITFAAALVGQSITLTRGELPVTDDLTITGNVTLNAGGSSRIFNITSAAAGGVTLSGLTLTNGRVTGETGGAGVYTTGTALTLNDVTISNSRATNANASGGGLLVASGDVSVNNSTVTGNAAVRAGGGIEVLAGNVTLNRSTLSDNTAGRILEPLGDDSTYIALGDSITYGETDLAYVPDNGTIDGYPTLVADYLATQNSGVRPDLINLAIDGETADSFMDNTGRTPPVEGRTDTPLQLQNTNYDSTDLISQRQRFLNAVADQEEAGDDIDYVSITLGFNELAALASQPNPLTLIDSTLETYKTNYSQVLSMIKDAAPDAELILLNYYNPFPADDNQNPARAIFDAAGTRLNAIIQELATQYGGTYVDTATPFVGKEAAYTYLDEVGAGDTTPAPYSPTDVGLAPIGNVHPNGTGYGVIAAQVIDAIDDGDSLTGNPGNGGGLHVTGAATVRVLRSTITDNDAASEGGGLWNSATGMMTVSGSDITDNSAQGDAADDGGGGVFNNGGSLQIADSRINGNKANGTNGSGGALFSVAGNIGLNRVNISQNTANRAGGGIELIDGNLSLRFSQLTENVAGPDGSAAPGNGGGLHTTGTANVGFFRSSAINNIAASEGGGLWLAAGGRLDSSGSAVGGNEAQGDAADNGGGGFFNNGGDAYLGFTTFYDNEANGTNGSGGGVFSVDGSVKLNRLTIRDNEASRAGGGIEIIDGDLQLLTVVLNDNSTGAAPGNGGGLHVTGTDTDVLVSRSFVQNNTAASEGGGLWNQQGSRLRVEGSAIFDNVASGTAADNGGGGIFNNGGELTVISSRLGGNNANGTRGSGGGIHNAAGGTATVQDTRISGGRAFYNGGGVYNAGVANFDDSQIFFNRARVAGGIFTDAAGATDLDNTRVRLNNPNNTGGTGVLT